MCNFLHGLYFYMYSKEKEGKWGRGEKKGEYPELEIRRKENKINRSSEVQSPRTLTCTYLSGTDDNHPAVS